MSLIKIISRDADNITLNYKDLVITDWARPEQIELNERILILDLDTRTHPDSIHYRNIADRALEIQEGIRPFLRSDGVVIAYLSPRNTLWVYRADGEIATGNCQILEQVGLGLPFGGEWNRYDCTSVVDDDTVKRYVDLVNSAESYLEINNPDFDSEKILIKRGEYGAVCGAVYKNFAGSGNGTLITLPRPENLTVRPEVWFRRTLSVALLISPKIFDISFNLKRVKAQVENNWTILSKTSSIFLGVFIKLLDNWGKDLTTGIR